MRLLCGFDIHYALPSEATFSLAFDEISTSELMQCVHTRMILFSSVDSTKMGTN
jgi:hypothetical protein